MAGLPPTADVVVIGGGIAGVSVAAELAPWGTVVLCEAESQLAHHTTGRSAAMFTETYGSAPVRALTVASRPAFENPHEAFDGALLRPRGVLWIAGADDVALAEAEAATFAAMVPSVRFISGSEARTICPVLVPEVTAAGIDEPDAADIDVHALLTGYRRMATGAGAVIAVDATVLSGARVGSGWRVQTSAGTIEAGTVVNAAGAWGDEVAAAFGVAPVGLTPLRRTAFLFAIPGVAADPEWPLVITVGEGFYFKPEGGRLLGSPADETPSPPCDARPEEIDVALALDRISTAVGVEVRHASHPWAGLRTFSPDRTPVVGRDPGADGFVWLVGQGGYGIQTAPAMASVAAAAVRGEAARGITPAVVAALAPDRFRGAV